MTRYYIKLGSEVPFGTSEHRISYDPTDLSTITALWAAIPPDLRLALAKTAPKVAGPWCHEASDDFYWRSEHVTALQRDGSGPRRFARASIAGVTPWGDGTFSAETMFGDLGKFASLASAQAACDAALIAQGYVLDGDTP